MLKEEASLFRRSTGAPFVMAIGQVETAEEPPRRWRVRSWCRRRMQGTELLGVVVQMEVGDE